jgi:hypothetical protein
VYNPYKRYIERQRKQQQSEALKSLDRLQDGKPDSTLWCAVGGDVAFIRVSDGHGPHQNYTVRAGDGFTLTRSSNCDTCGARFRNSQEVFSHIIGEHRLMVEAMLGKQR